MYSISASDGAAWFAGAIQASCGSSRENIESLVKANSDVTLSTHPGLRKFFERLGRYGEKKGVHQFRLEDLVRYFSSGEHLEEVRHFAPKTAFGELYGVEAGIAAHLLLPLEGARYINHDINFEVDGFYLKAEEGNVPFIHNGLIVHLPVQDELTQEVLDEQFRSPVTRVVLQSIDQLLTPKAHLELLGLVSTIFS